MIRKLVLLVAGLALLLLGLVGLVLPVLPGVLLLAAAALCFSMASRRLRTRLEARLQHSPRYRMALRRWQAADSLPPWRRAQLGFWLMVASILPARAR